MWRWRNGSSSLEINYFNKSTSFLREINRRPVKTPLLPHSIFLIVLPDHSILASYCFSFSWAKRNSMQRDSTRRTISLLTMPREKMGRFRDASNDDRPSFSSQWRWTTSAVGTRISSIESVRFSAKWWWRWKWNLKEHRFHFIEASESNQIEESIQPFFSFLTGVISPVSKWSHSRQLCSLDSRRESFLSTVIRLNCWNLCGPCWSIWSNCTIRWERERERDAKWTSLEPIRWPQEKLEEQERANNTNHSDLGRIYWLVYYHPKRFFYPFHSSSFSVSSDLV